MASVFFPIGSENQAKVKVLQVNTTFYVLNFLYVIGFWWTALMFRFINDRWKKKAANFVKDKYSLL